MNGSAEAAIGSLERRFLIDHPWDAARLIETLAPREAAKALARQETDVLVPVWRRLMNNLGARLILLLPPNQAAELLTELLPNESARLLSTLEAEDRERLMAQLDPDIASELATLMSYPERSAGRLMTSAVHTFRATMTVGQTIDRMRQFKAIASKDLFLVDDDNRMIGRVPIHSVAVSYPEKRLNELAKPITAYVNPLASQEEVASLLDADQLPEVPVVDAAGILIGVIQQAALVDTIQADASVNIQTMVGASKDERALSSPFFALRKRLPWLQINLLTAFLAASVVGIFENTIATFTALAVLLPVVAGQSGNAGAQALAVTMRGLALREISPRQWASVTIKEVSVGFMNGIAVAITCGIGVYFWSGSIGLVIVIAMSMVLAMIAAGFAGAIVPIFLTKIGQDPAQSSSIILTTVTDVAGFFSFLGIATLLSAML